MTRISIVFIFMSALTAFAATVVFAESESKGASATYSSADNWYRPYSGSPLLQQKNLVPKGSVRPVPDNLQPEAQALLQNEAWRELSTSEASAFGVAGLLKSSKERLILLRGVVLNEATGAFEVYEQDGNVLVLHISMGKKAVPMRRKAVVAVLQNKPKEVFVSCSMIE
jgi:hypothetical protein